MAQFNFRLFLRPTAIGKAIIERLSADGAERQADSRRWIELGYALEQAGFRLDGTTLYLGGRPFAAEQTLTVQVPVPAQESKAMRAPAYQAAAAMAAAEPISAGAGLADAFVDAGPLSAPAISSVAAPVPVPVPVPAPAPAALARPIESAPQTPVSTVPPQPARQAAIDDEMAANLRGLSA